ncbi:MAG: SprB repeat-containing protein, partial [Flavobacteriales bacterium]|nr:SprB repeat-containing protein [Flavobacteriales bacterium]
MMRFANILFVVMFSLVFTFEVSSQCDPTVPSFVVDLSGNVDSLWISPDTSRVDNCCGTTSPDRCIRFILTLHPDAQGIIFDIYSGAVPPGALFYQIACGVQYPVGEILCLDGPGPHDITFCKPGNNQNEYSIKSVPAPDISPPIVVNDGCQDILYVSGLDDTTIVWQSIFPGALGDYDSYLDCTEDCDTVIVTAQLGFPTYVDFVVCGMPAGGCDIIPFCDTVRAYFNSTLTAQILPQSPTICFGSTGTTITANGSGGTFPYSYLWNTGETTQSIFISSVGTYWVELGDTSNCPPTYDTVDVTEFLSPIIANAGADQTVCRQTGDVSLSGSVLSATGGVWSGGNGVYTPNDSNLIATYTPTATELSSGSIELYLTTAGNGTCPADVDTVLINFVSFDPVIATNVVNVSCNGFSDGNAVINLSGGETPYSYLWSTGDVVDSVTGLAAGSYSVTLTNGNGCDTTIFVTVTEPQSLSVTLNTATDVSCSGFSDGAVDISVAGGTTAYSYLWDSGEASEDAVQLNAGVNIVTVTDANSCMLTFSVTINEPSPLAITISNVNSTCGSSNGSLDAIVSGGTTPYLYLWSNSSLTSSISGLNVGVYVVTVQDFNSCSITSLGNISDPVPITDITDSTNISCFGGADGTAHVSANSGTTPYVYSWSGGQTDSIATGLGAGIHTVTVTDNIGCKSAEQVELTEPSDLLLTITQSNVSCFGLSDGTATISASGGTTGYSYLWNTPSTNSSITSLVDGIYSVTVTDVNLCAKTVSLTITEPLALSLSYSFTDVSCNGGSDGTLSLSALGGNIPYVFYLDGAQVNSFVDNLGAGVYVVSISDNNGCSLQESITITEPLAAINLIMLSTPISCFGLSDGTATVSASGGTTPYSYQWGANTGNQTNATALNLLTNSYSVTLTDANNCDVTNIGTVNVTQPQQPISVTLTPVNVSCFNGSDGEIISLVVGGTTPYSYLWSNGESSGNINQLVVGNYILTVTDNNGCQFVENITITEPGPLNTTITGINTTCFQFSNGSALVSASGGTLPYSYVWSNNATSEVNTNISAGSYSVTVSDVNLCSTTVSITISEPVELTSVISITDVLCNNGN